MDSSSDEHFAWTDASSDDSSKQESPKNIMPQHEKTNLSGDDSESGKTFKKRLQEQLFSNIKNEDSINDDKFKNKRKRKLSDKSERKSKKIKIEPSSDAELPKKKRQNSHLDTNGFMKSEDSYDETYLDLMVKNEQKVSVPSPAKSKKGKNTEMSHVSKNSITSSDGTDVDISLATTPHNKTVETDTSCLENDHKSEKKKKKLKKKRRHSENNVTNSENEINLMVKTEQKISVPSPVKSKKGQNRETSHVSNNTTITSSDGTDADNSLASTPYNKTEEIDSSCHENDHVDGKTNKKSKKKRKPSENDVMNSDNELNLMVKKEQKVSVPSPAKSKIERKNRMMSHVRNNSITSSDGTEAGSSLKTIPHSKTVEIGTSFLENDNIGGKKKKKLKKKRKNSENNVRSSDNEANSTSEDVVAAIEHNKSGDTHKESVADELHTTSNTFGSNRKSRLSDRIQFEDDEDMQEASKPVKPVTDKSSKKTSKLRNYIECNVHLKPFQVHFPSELSISEDDDIWVVKCPKDTAVEDFQDKNWVLDNKCKIKLDGERYEGRVDSTLKNLCVFSADGDNCQMKKIPMNGFVTLYKRLPKGDIREENIMANNNNFIPLPEIKCRHPLFGLHYKKAIKLPSAVVERLNEQHSEGVTVKRKNKKCKKEKIKDNTESNITASKGSAVDYEVNVDQDASLTKKKKKKKRRRSDREELTPVHTHKRSKLDPQHVQNWDSEKDIEENLFNY